MTYITHNSRFVSDLVRSARDGEYALPMFQRGFVWEVDDVLKLLDSILVGYPIGSLLTWERWGAHVRQVRNFQGVDKTQPRAALVLDGQQRIQALLTATAENSGYYYDVEQRGFVHDPSAQEGKTHIALHRLLCVADYLCWLQNTMQGGIDEVVITHMDEVMAKFRDARIGEVAIAWDADLAFARESFRRLNTTGKSFSEQDVFACLEETAA